MRAFVSPPAFNSRQNLGQIVIVIISIIIINNNNNNNNVLNCCNSIDFGRTSLAWWKSKESHTATWPLSGHALPSEWVSPQLSTFSAKQCDGVARPFRQQTSRAGKPWKHSFWKEHWCVNIWFNQSSQCSWVYREHLQNKNPANSQENKADFPGLWWRWKKWLDCSFNNSRIPFLFVPCFISSLWCPYWEFFCK